MLEHVPDPIAFLRSLRDTLPSGVPFFLEVPDLDWILEAGAFWVDTILPSFRTARLVVYLRTTYESGARRLCAASWAPLGSVAQDEARHRTRVLSSAGRSVPMDARTDASHKIGRGGTG